MVVAGLKEQATVNSLDFRSLNGMNAKDAWVNELAGLKNLTTLYRVNTNVTDASLKELAGLKSPTKLYVVGANATAAGITELQKSLPRCLIKR